MGVVGSYGFLPLCSSDVFLSHDAVSVESARIADRNADFWTCPSYFGSISSALMMQKKIRGLVHLG